MTKEQIYDEQIYPLMDQIVGICQERGIAMFASFAIPNDDKKHLKCTTHLPDGNGEFDRLFVRAAISVKLPGIHMTAERPDGLKTITVIP